MEERDPVVDEVRETFTLKTFQERVFRLEGENKELKVTNSILQTQYNSHCETQSDILRTLHANLDENYSKIEESDNRIQRLEQQLEDQKQEAKDKLEEERLQSDQRAHELQTRNDILQAALDEVNEFKLNKDRLEEELSSLKRQLQDQAAAHTRDVSAFDRKKAIEIDQLKKDMQKNIKETREYLKARTKDQLDSTTKRTIMENEQMATELHFQSKETERLLDRNQQLMDENAQLRRNLQIHKDLENELARRTHVYQKLIKKMGQRAKAEPAVADGSRELQVDESLDELKAEKSLSVIVSTDHQASISSLSDENAQMKRQLDSQQSTLAMVRQEFAQYRRDHATLTQLQDQSTRLVIAALYELKNQRECDPFPPASYDEQGNWQFTNMTTRQKEYFFRVLLEKLNSSMCGSCFPTGKGGQSPTQSTSSLPAIPKQGEGNSFSHFLWSVATNGPQGGHQHSHAKKVSQAVQTETETTDPCFKEGLWNPSLRSRDVSNVTASMVVGNVRNWGPAANSRTRNSVPKASRIV
jgi:myosin heavy subunit